MASEKTRGPKRGSRRVEGWLYEVINPLLDALPTEMSFLEQGNVTWRFPFRKLEHLRPLDGYLAPHAIHILRDFQRANRNVRSRFERHDEMLVALAKAATKAYDSLVRRGDFQDQVRKSLAEFMEANPNAEYPGGAFPRAEFPNLIADHVVNWIRRIAPHHSDSTFWDRFGAEFLKFRSDPSFQALDAARASLLEYDRSLVKRLEEKSFDLCERYDIPAAPISSWAPQAP